MGDTEPPEDPDGVRMQRSPGGTSMHVNFEENDDGNNGDVISDMNAQVN